MATIKEAVEKIKRVGISNARATPTTTPGKSNIEINENGNWVVVLENVNTGAVSDIIRQASNRLIVD